MNRALQSFDGIIDELRLDGNSNGLLQGKSFVAKDLFDVAGHRTGAGNPDWLATHEPAKATASSIANIFAAGGRLIGKSCTDELAYSLDGINIHYGTPLNPQAPDCIPGGSSSGSASAVASGLADFALGTDTAGSIRVPASYCGVYSMRPTHGRIALDGAVPLGPSFDTVGWLATDVELLRAVGTALLGAKDLPAVPTNVRFVTDGFDMLTDDVRPAFERIRMVFRKAFKTDDELTFGSERLQHFVNCFNTLRGWEAWQCHGSWLESTQPGLAPMIRERFFACKQISEEQFEMASLERKTIIDLISATMHDDTTVLCLPATYGLPPLKTSSEEALTRNRQMNMRLCSIASIAGLPQVTIPISISATQKTGLSFIGRAGTDEMLLDLCGEFERVFRNCKAF